MVRHVTLARSAGRNAGRSAAQSPAPDRHEDRLRGIRVRILHGPGGRRADPLLHVPGGACRRKADPHDRRTGRVPTCSMQQAAEAESLHPLQQAFIDLRSGAVRFLHPRPDHDCVCAAAAQSEPQQRARSALRSRTRCAAAPAILPLKAPSWRRPSRCERASLCAARRSRIRPSPAAGRRTGPGPAGCG